MKSKNILPIGRSDFRELIRDECYYIDKSFAIKELMESRTLVYLIPRPRRFGKTLFQSLLRYFFEKDEEDNEWVFKDLSIYKTDIFKEHFAQYPVIYLSFKDIKESNIEMAFSKINYLIRKEFYRHEKILNQHIDRVDNENKKSYKRIISDKANQVDYENSLKLLSELLYLAYNKQVIFLLDEYDTPIQTAFFKGYYDEMIEFFKPFLGGVLKDNDKYLKKAVITGILRVSGESMFSDVNNLRVCTILDKPLSKVCGFTVEETKLMLKDFGLEEKQNEVINWYDGYNFGGNKILNPWSLINYVSNEEFIPYWANTSGNILIRVMIENSLSFRKDLELLLRGETIEQNIDRNITFENQNFFFDKDILYSFLFFSGYLKCENKRRDANQSIVCNLRVANTECRYIFNKIVRRWINSSFENYKLQEMLKALIRADLKLFERIFSEFVRDTLSFYDTAKRVENVYHAFLLGLLLWLNHEYEVISNQEAGYGRLDIMLLHKMDKSKPAIIMELKTIDDFEEETKEEALKSAVNQIREKEYITGAKRRGYNNIVAFGLVFEKKRVWIERV